MRTGCALLLLKVMRRMSQYDICLYYEHGATNFKFRYLMVGQVSPGTSADTLFRA